jgi:D,D-heptose 1,7-bisphosphate phosphatase
MNKAIFFDRDGTLIVDKGYNCKISQLEFFSDTIKVLKHFSDLSYKLVIITNQSGIGRGYYSKNDYNVFQKRFLNELSINKIKINKIYYCPHHPNMNCECRKPSIFLVKKAQNYFNLNLSLSYFVGDKDEDIKCGRDSGCKTVRIKSGYPQNETSDFFISSLIELIDVIK